MDLFNSAAFDARVHDLMSEWPAPGLAIAIVQNSTVASKAFGQANLNHATPMTTNTLFDIASCSKSFTAASIALFVENDDYPYVEWDSTMSSLLPDDFAYPGTDYTNNVTVEDILSHRSGMPGHDFAWLGAVADRPSTPQSITRDLRNLAVAAPIRSKFIYSNMMYIVASYLVEQLSGSTFEQYLHDYIFR